MINIYKYIPSRDIREYLKRLNYHFSLIQSFFLIGYDRNNHSLEERKRDYKKLLDEYKRDVKFRKMACPPPGKTVKDSIKMILDGEEEEPPDCFDFIPVPFKPGDIVEEAGNRRNSGIPMIIMENGYEDQLKTERSIYHQYDEPIINCYYFYNELFYYDHIYAMDVEYYRREKTADYYRLLLIRDYMFSGQDKYALCDLIAASTAFTSSGRIRDDYWGSNIVEEKIGKKETEKLLEAKHVNNSKNKENHKKTQRR